MDPIECEACEKVQREQEIMEEIRKKRSRRLCSGENLERCREVIRLLEAKEEQEIRVT